MNNNAWQKAVDGLDIAGKLDEKDIGELRSSLRRRVERQGVELMAKARIIAALKDAIKVAEVPDDVDSEELIDELIDKLVERGEEKQRFIDDQLRALVIPIFHAEEREVSLVEYFTGAQRGMVIVGHGPDEFLISLYRMVATCLDTGVLLRNVVAQHLPEARYPLRKGGTLVERYLRLTNSPWYDVTLFMIGLVVELGVVLEPVGKEAVAGMPETIAEVLVEVALLQQEMTGVLAEAGAAIANMRGD